MDSIYEQWKRDFVASRVLKRDRNIGQFGCVIHEISNKVFRTGQAAVSFFAVQKTWFIFFFFLLLESWFSFQPFFLHACWPGRRLFFFFVPPPVPASCIAAMLCWFFRRGACHRCRSSPWPFFLLASSHRFIHVSICSPSLWPGNYV